MDKNVYDMINCDFMILITFDLKWTIILLNVSNNFCNAYWQISYIHLK